MVTSNRRQELLDLLAIPRLLDGFPAALRKSTFKRSGASMDCSCVVRTKGITGVLFGPWLIEMSRAALSSRGTP
jgi:hypothetical protein